MAEGNYSFLMQNCSQPKRHFYKLLERLSDRKNCLTVTDIDGEFEESKKVTNYSICIPNGINPEELDGVIKEAQGYRKPNKKYTVCTMGKVVPQKNPELFNEIAEAFPDIDFLWIGEGELKKCAYMS